MNYINQTNIFFRLAGSAELTSSARILYLALLNKNNSLAWIRQFTCTATELEGLSGLGKSSLKRSRQQLADKGLIKYKKRGNKAPRYSIIELNDGVMKAILDNHMSDLVPQVNPQTDPQVNPQVNPQTDPQTGPLNKLNQTKQKQEEEDTHARIPPQLKNVPEVFELWQKLWGFPNAIAQKDLDTWTSEFGPDIVYLAIWYAAKRNVLARSADTWLDRTFEDWRKSEVNTVAKAKQAIKLHEQRNSTIKGGYLNKRATHKESLPDWAKDKPKNAPAKQPEKKVSEAEKKAIQAKLAQFRKSAPASEEGRG